jgi:hypothetical protein
VSRQNCILIMSWDVAGLQRRRHNCLPSIATELRTATFARTVAFEPTIPRYGYGPAGSSSPGLWASKTVPRSSASSSTKPAITKLIVISAFTVIGRIRPATRGGVRDAARLARFLRSLCCVTQFPLVFRISRKLLHLVKVRGYCALLSHTELAWSHPMVQHGWPYGALCTSACGKAPQR